MQSTDTTTPAGFIEREHLFGDWLGVRTSLAEHGVSPEISFTQFYQGLAEGENQRGTEYEYGGKGDAFLKIDGDKAGLWKGLFLESHAELRYGDAVIAAGSTLTAVGTALLFPQSEGTELALSSLVVTQFLSPNVAVTVGRIDFIDAYEKPFTGGRGIEKFMNVSFAVPPLMAGTVPPVTALAAGVIVLHGTDPVATFMVYDPRDASTVTGFDSDLFDDVAMMAEVTLPIRPFGLTGHYAFGGEFSTRDAVSFDQNPFVFIPGVGVVSDIDREDDFWTIHFTFDQMLYRYGDAVEKEAGFGLFGLVGRSDGNPSPLRLFAHAGVGGQSPIPTRRRDEFGLGWFYAALSDDLQETLRPLIDLGDEQGFEAYYDLAVTGWLHLTGDLQVIGPFNNRAETGTFLGLRARIDF